MSGRQSDRRFNLGGDSVHLFNSIAVPRAGGEYVATWVSAIDSYGQPSG